MSSNKCNQFLKIVGDFWNLSIIIELKKGGLRFCQLQRALNNLNPVTLTDRLKKLEEAGFIDRKTDPKDKVSVKYLLNNKGRKILPIVDQIQIFSSKLN